MFIKAAMQATSSVLMAETVTLAFATTLSTHLELSNVNFISDNRQLVNFLNGSDLSNPPDWRIKPFTKMVTSSAAVADSSIHRIKRRHKQMAGSLTR
jgi:hypothetical protein